MDPLLLLSATELAERIRTRQVTSREVVQAHITRARDVGPWLRAIVVDRFDAALEEADEADAVLASGEVVGPLHGVPCTIKEAFAVTGMPNSAGLLSRKDVRSDHDCTQVERLREAGAIVLGVTNLSELCMWMESDNPVYGRTVNPYDASRAAGGSSGGEGAIVGSGASPFGLGSDVGGSIRIPAFFDGVFGHKPSPGLVPNVGQFPVNESLDGLRMLATGPLCRHVDDLHPLLEILRGPTPEDPVANDLPLGDPDTVSIRGLHVLDVRRKVSPPLAQCQQDAADALVAQGASVQSASFAGFDRAFDIWSLAMSDAEGKGRFREMLGYARKRDLLPHVLRPHELGGTHSLPATILGLVEDIVTLLPGRAQAIREAHVELKEALLTSIADGVMLFPSFRTVAPKHRRALLVPHWSATFGIFNALGFPVTQVPMGLDHHGIPLGVQVVGTPGNDHLTIAVAKALVKGGLAGWVPPLR